MIRLRHKILIQIFRFSDQAILVLSLYLALYIRPYLAGTGAVWNVFDQAYRVKDVAGIAVLLLGWGIVFHLIIRTPGRFKPLRSQLFDLLKPISTATFWLLVVSALFSFSRITPLVIFLFWVLSLATTALSRVLIRRLLTVARKSGYNYRYLLIVGCNQRSIQLARKIEASPELGYKIVGFVDERSFGFVAPEEPPDIGHWKVVGSLSNLQPIFEHGTVDEVMIGLSLVENFPIISEIIRLGRELGIVVRLMPEPAYAKVLQQLQVEAFDGDYVVTFFRDRLLVQLLFKRIVDVVVSLATLAFLSPLLLVVIIAIKTTSSGPILFVQERVGMNRRRFKLYKFRSMVADAETRQDEVAHLNEMDGPVFKVRGDPRVTRVGRILRKTSLDEIPQLVNVIWGEMSLVGPRPPLPSEVERYDWGFQKRLSVKPGITCLWQVAGRNRVSFSQWMELDREYIENWSIWLDLKVLFKTIPAVLLGRGAS